MDRQEVMVKAAGFTYRVVIDQGSLGSCGKSLRLLFPSSRVLLVSDSKVFSLYGETVTRSLQEQQWQVEKVIIRPGERAKSLAGAARLYDAAARAGLDRNSPVVALGGGVVGDLAGFAAATYLRGVPLVMLPTSLLAQVDSSVGGKVAVNHPLGKNLIGSFYPPRLVVIDPLVLKTLPPRELKAGLAEVVKYGIIMDGAFFDLLEKNLDGLLEGESDFLSEAIVRSVRAKVAVVEKDEFEGDYRRILNFGHTIGHAFEAATGYRHYLHGEAVLIGMIGAVRLAGWMELLDGEGVERMVKMFRRMGIRKPPPDLTAAMLMDKLRQDKKRQDDRLIFILPRSPGKVTIVPVDDRKLIEAVLEDCLMES